MKSALRRGLTYAILAVLAAGGLFALTLRQPVCASAGEVQRIEVSARPITHFRIGSDETRFGPIEFVGGLEMTSRSGDFGGFSSFRFLTPGRDFIGVSDSGFWFFGSVARDVDGTPSGFENFRMQQMFDRAGSLSDRKWAIDAEGLAVKGDIATVGFERDHRISQFRIQPGGMQPALRNLDFLIPKRELRQNRGFETVAYAPANGRHEGGLVLITERSLDAQGNIFAAILEGPDKGILTVKRIGEFDITDGAFLPNGDLLLLERSFSVLTGVKMRLRRIHGESIARGEIADGPVLLEADMLYQIDNMEGLDVWVRDDGAQMVSLISDDNHSLFQRNLYLEFVLHED